MVDVVYQKPPQAAMRARAGVFDAWLEGQEFPVVERVTWHLHMLTAKGLTENQAKELLAVVYCLVSIRATPYSTTGAECGRSVSDG